MLRMQHSVGEIKLSPGVKIRSLVQVKKAHVFKVCVLYDQEVSDQTF